MDELTARLIAFDDAGDYLGMAQFIPTALSSIIDLVHPAYQLMNMHRYHAAYILYKIAEVNNFGHPILACAGAVGAQLQGNKRDLEAALLVLRKTVTMEVSAASGNLLYALMSKVILNILSTQFPLSDVDKVLSVLEILTAAVPQFGQWFDLNAPVPVFDPEAARQRGQAKSHLLLQYPSPEPALERPRRRVVVGIREKIYPDQDWSRALDLGPRMVESFKHYGWDAYFCPLHWKNTAEDYGRILQMCVEVKADIVILDDTMVAAAPSVPLREGMIRSLRQILPQIKVVGVQFDTWTVPQDVLVSTAKDLDLLWEVTDPSLSALWQRPDLKTFVLHSQVPHAAPCAGVVAPLKKDVLFAGGIKGYNWHRAFWMSAALQKNLPVVQKLSSHADDGLGVIESYRLYLKGLEEATSSLNFSMRSDLTRIVTGRCFETIAAGALLIQEQTDNMDYYFIEGEHYLSFTTFSELRSIFNFLAERKDEAEEIRRRGAEFYRQTYNDDKLVGYLDYALFHRPSA